MAAIYCNWLHNDKRTDRAAFLSGAYDVSTFGYFQVSFTDQVTRSPGAKFFVPSWDEWLKAAHYDPNRNGTGQGGYWQYSITSDTEPVSGPPGVRVRVLPNGDVVADPNGVFGQVNTGGWRDNIPSVSPYAIPLGAYSTIQSPWGLLDVGGATTEWTEGVVTLASGDNYRIFDGSWWTDGMPGNDSISYEGGADLPSIPIFEHGFRVAAAIPAPSVGVVCAFAACCWSRRRNRR